MIAFLMFFGVVALIAILRFFLIRNKTIKIATTWDCGYADPTPRMQYTASSFAQPITRMFCGLLRTQLNLQPPEGIFPKSAFLKSHTPDVLQELLFRPIFVGIRKVLEAFRWLQHGNVHLYVLYILIALIILMFWKLQ